MMPTTNMHVLLRATAVVWLCGLARVAVGATEISQYGITWTLSEDRPVGQFANGDWWVVGPVTIIRIDPAAAVVSDKDINGTMINPTFSIPPQSSIPNQGWDGRLEWKACGPKYDEALNVAKRLPCAVPAGSSVMSAKSFVENAPGDDQQLETVAILTVLETAPPPGSFRPPYIGGVDKHVRWNKRQLRYDRLRKLAPVPGAPTFAELEPSFERAFITLGPAFMSNYLSPKTAEFPSYGRETSHKVSAAALMLNLNYPDAEKETLVIRLVQRGIDFYGVLAAGGGWWADGGHNHGRKFPVVFAGVMLDDADIKARAGEHNFQEDVAHAYVSQNDVDQNAQRAVHNTEGIAATRPPMEPYTPAMIGTPEWFGAWDHSTAGSQWNTIYRDVNGSSLIGSVLAARLMGLEAVWNHPATFDYYDRYWQKEGVEKGNISTGVNSIQPFVAEMWKAYRGTAPRSAAAAN
ncbi:MAG: hypothetical protein K8T26_01170 [Lentisphaerae bacterium]|nr:hypothetical protein [Lentisphaerota bacterium]